MTLRDDLTDVLSNRNVQAFLRVIRNGETNQEETAYRMLFGGELVDSLTDHPRRKITRGSLTSSAAGAYQFLERTWDECAEALGLLNFQPGAQDLAAVYLIRRRGALPDVLAGRLEDAIAKCAKEWASLPGSPYGQPVKTMAQCREVYLRYGGEIAGTNEWPEVKPVQPEAKPMAPILAALLPSLVEAIPRLGQLFAKSDNDKRNVKAAEEVFKVAKEALGAVNEQEVIEMVKSDPQAVKAVSQAVEAQWYTLTQEVGGGVEAARKADAAFATGEARFLHSPAFWITLALLPLVYMASHAVLYTQGFSNDIKAMVLGAIFGGLLTGGINAFWFGTSASSQRKTELMAK